MSSYFRIRSLHFFVAAATHGQALCKALPSFSFDLVGIVKEYATEPRFLHSFSTESPARFLAVDTTKVLPSPSRGSDFPNYRLVLAGPNGLSLHNTHGELLQPLSTFFDVGEGRGVCADSNNTGAVYFATKSNGLYEYKHAKFHQLFNDWTHTLHKDMYGLCEIDGVFYVCVRGMVNLFDWLGNLKASTTPAVDMSRPWGCAFDLDRNELYVSDAEKRCVYVFHRNDLRFVRRFNCEHFK